MTRGVPWQGDFGFVPRLIALGSAHTRGSGKQLIWGGWGGGGGEEAKNGAEEFMKMSPRLVRPSG